MVERGFDYLQKYLIIGDQQVGKTSISERVFLKEFKESYSPTIGVELLSRKFDFGDKRIKLQLWDTAGNERHRSIISGYYKGSNAIIGVYDITNKKSFESIKNQLSCLKILDAVILLIGNKIDLIEKREVERSEAEEYAKTNGFLFMEVSAKTDDYIHEILYKLVKEVFNKLELNAIATAESLNSTSRVSLNREKVSKCSLPILYNSSTVSNWSDIEIGSSSRSKSRQLIDVKSNSILLSNIALSRFKDSESRKIIADVIK